MIPFDLAEPTSLAAAIKLLNPDDPSVRPIAGGTAPTDGCAGADGVGGAAAGGGACASGAAPSASSRFGGLRRRGSGDISMCC